jgi:hypothetical protein
VATTPTAHADILANALAKLTVNDEYVNDPTGAGGAPMTTDWIVSQPTRRYFAAIDYNGGKNPGDAKATDAYIVYNLNAAYNAAEDPGTGGAANSSAYASGFALQGFNAASSASVIPPYGPWSTASSALPYAGLNGGKVGTNAGGAVNLSISQGVSGPVTCWTSGSKIFDREETTGSVQAQFSPGYNVANFCGEVAVLSWGGSPLHAALSDTNVTAGAYQSGWASFTPDIGKFGAYYGLPITGFAAINGIDGAQGYGITWPLRW